ncbi:hypothetical protein FQZ97_881750 [compost metagenome]
MEKPPARGLQHPELLDGQHLFDRLGRSGPAVGAEEKVLELLLMGESSLINGVLVSGPSDGPGCVCALL